MHKELVNKAEIFDLIVNCYQSDLELVQNYHVLAGRGLSACIDRTASDFITSNTIKIFKLTKGDKFLGYFGDENGEFLTGFFIMPEFRDTKSKQSFWNTVVNHFKGSFNVGIFDNNIRAAKFLDKMGCVKASSVVTADGPGTFYVYDKGVI